MAANDATMIRTAVQVQAAMLTSSLQVVSHAARFAAASAAALVQVVAQPLSAPPVRRQAAFEDVAWAAYAEQRAMLRGATGLSRLAVLTFMNELDRGRGDRPVPPSLLDRSQH